MHPDKMDRNKFISTNMGNGRDERIKKPQWWHWQKLQQKEIVELFLDFESLKCQMLEVDSGFEEIVATHQDIKCSLPYINKS